MDFRLRNIKLIPSDYIFTGPGSQPITFAFYYPYKLDADIIKTTLQKTLNYFPILQSELFRSSENHYEFKYSEKGLTFNIYESELLFKEFKNIKQFIEPVDTVEGKPLTKITLTQTPSGSVLAVSISHALVDGFSYFHFLSSWARINRGDRVLQPSLDRTGIVSDYHGDTKTIITKDIFNRCGLFYGKKRSNLNYQVGHQDRIYISRDTIRSNMEEYKKQESVLVLSENDIITAMLWKKYLPQWLTEKDNPATYVTCPFDYRRVLISIQNNYLGCAICFATASISYNDLKKLPIRELAYLVRRSIGKVKENYILNFMQTLERLRNQEGISAFKNLHLRHPQHGIIVTNLTQLPIRDLCFGLGPPMDFLTYAEVPGSAAILPAENGVEILVSHPLHGN
jgi:shikimate O-hydroxycinnamoyltransferase